MIEQRMTIHCNEFFHNYECELVTINYIVKMHFFNWKIPSNVIQLQSFTFLYVREKSKPVHNVCLIIHCEQLIN